MTSSEIRPTQTLHIPHQPQSPEGRQRPSEFISMDAFWNEIVVACQPFSVGNSEKQFLISDPRLSRQHLYDLFHVSELHALYESSQQGIPQITTDDETGKKTRITLERDGTLHVSMYLPGLGSSKDTIDMYYRKENTGEKIKIDTHEYILTGENIGERQDRTVTLFFSAQEVPEVDEFVIDYEDRYEFLGDDGKVKIDAEFIEDGEDVWGEIHFN